MATTPELFAPHIAAARAQAWHQAPSPEQKIPEAHSSKASIPEAATAEENSLGENTDASSPEAGSSDESSPEEGTSEASRPEASSPEANSPDETTLAASSSKTVAPSSNKLLTLEAARTFLNEHGLLLFAPRPLGAPAPSLVEATLGEPRSSVTAAEAETARGLVARLVAEGSALPLNLLGGPGEIPDFVVSAGAFPFVFTLRGDKGWKRAPETSGAVKVTPLALRVYELLAEKGALRASALVPEIGREVTESAISRALTELWSLLRVFPALQQGGGETLWELTTTRFLKAVKAGANAGQPTALSALVSLYLGQVFLATEEEIAAFLSPLTARSRVRDVLHGLIAGRQLSEGVLEGKIVLHIPDALPEFAQFGRTNTTSDQEALVSDEAPAERAEGEAAAEGRIRRFQANGEAGTRSGNELRGKPAPGEGGFRSGPRPGAKRPGFGDHAPRKFTGDRPARSAGAREDRPFRPRPARDAAEASGKPSFTRPWDEDRANRPRPAGEGETAGPGQGERPARSRFAADSRPSRREGGPGAPGSSRPAFRREGGAGSRPPFRPAGGEGGRPPFRREGGEGGRPPFRPSGGEGGRPPFRREGSDGGRPPFRPSGGEGGRPSFRREGSEGGRPPFRPSGGEGGRPSFRREGSEGGRPPFRPSGGENARPPFRREGGEGGRPPFRSSGGGGRPPFRREGGEGSRPPFRAPGAEGGRPPFRREGPGADRAGSFDRTRSDRGDRGDRGSFGSREGAPGRDFGGPPRRGPAGGGGSRPSFGDRPARGGEGQRSRPQGGGFSRGPGPGGPRFGGAGPRGPRPGGARFGAPGGFAKRTPGSADRDRPAPRKRPEDEAS